MGRSKEKMPYWGRRNPYGKEMGLNPKSLVKNIPSKKEMWKASVKDWIHDMYDKRQRKSQQRAKRKAAQQNKSNITASKPYGLGAVFLP